MVLGVLGILAWVATGGLNGGAVVEPSSSAIGVERNGKIPNDSDSAAGAATRTQAQARTAPAPYPFHSATPKFAVAAYDTDGNPVTLPWQPVCLGAGSTSQQQQQQQPRHALGVIGGHGLHCDMRSVPWLLSRVNRQIPTAVFSVRGSGTGATAFSTGSEAWLKGVLDAKDDPRPLDERLYNRLGYRAQRHDFVKVADAAGYERFIIVAESQSTVAGMWAAVELAVRRQTQRGPPPGPGGNGRLDLGMSNRMKRNETK